MIASCKREGRVTKRESGDGVNKMYNDSLWENKGGEITAAEDILSTHFDFRPNLRLGAPVIHVLASSGCHTTHLADVASTQREAVRSCDLNVERFALNGHADGVLSLSR